MLTLILTVLLGLGFALFATQNTGVVTLNFGQFYLYNIPLYLVILATLIIGLCASFIIYITRDLSARLTEDEMKDELKKLKSENAELVKSLHKFELENTKLKAKTGEEFDDDSI